MTYQKARYKRRYGSGYHARRKKIKTRLIELFGSICQECKQEKGFYELTIDHIVEAPKTERQNNKLVNLRLLCLPCHQTKHNQIPNHLNEI